jgi:hypothetical protein
MRDSVALILALEIARIPGKETSTQLIFVAGRQVSACWLALSSLGTRAIIPPGCWQKMYNVNGVEN